MRAFWVSHSALPFQGRPVECIRLRSGRPPLHVDSGGWTEAHVPVPLGKARGFLTDFEVDGMEPPAVLFGDPLADLGGRILGVEDALAREEARKETTAELQRFGRRRRCSGRLCAGGVDRKENTDEEK